MPGRPVHHSHEVEKALRHRDIGDVRAPHVVGNDVRLTEVGLQVSFGDRHRRLRERLGLETRGVRELEDGRVIIADGFGGAVIVRTPGVGADTLTKLQGNRRSITRRTASSPCLMVARSSSTSAMRGSPGSRWSSASVKRGRSHREPPDGAGDDQSVGTDRTGGIYFRQAVGGDVGWLHRSRHNSRYSTRCSRYSSPTGPVMVSRQERQIVQSWLDLDDFLPGFTSPLRGL